MRQVILKDQGSKFKLTITPDQIRVKLKKGASAEEKKQVISVAVMLAKKTFPTENTLRCRFSHLRARLDFWTNGKTNKVHIPIKTGYKLVRQ